MKYLTIRGQTKSISAWAREAAVSRSGIDFRLTVLGWDPERAVFAPTLRPRSAIGYGKRRPTRFKAAPRLPKPILPRWGSVESVTFGRAA